MNTVLRNCLTITVVAIISTGCQPQKMYDLGLTHVTLLDVRTGRIMENKNIFIKDGWIETISETVLKSKEIIDVGGNLITPGLIDTHIHPTDVFGDFDNAPKFLPSDHLAQLRKQLSDEYLPYGTTTVMTMGQPDNWLKPLLIWKNASSPDFVDLLVSGGALISKDNRVPYIAHTEVISPEAARRKIVQYDSLGIQHLKLYYRLKEPEFSAVLKTADSLHMKTYGHTGDANPDYLKMDHALQKGMHNFEHLAVIPSNIITTPADWDLVRKQFSRYYGEMDSKSKVMAFFLEQYRFVSEQKSTEMNAFIDLLAQKRTTLSTTIHILYEDIAPTWFTQNKDTLATPVQLQRSRENFEIMMRYAKKMHQRGIELRLGSDMPEGGKVNISELMILAQYGFSIPDIFKIASYNGAKALGIDEEVGSIESNKKANLIIWEKNPLEDPRYFNSKRIVIKNGRLLR